MRLSVKDDGVKCDDYDVYLDGVKLDLKTRRVIEADEERGLLREIECDERGNVRMVILNGVKGLNEVTVYGTVRLRKKESRAMPTIV